MDSNKYTFRSRVRYSELDKDKKMTLNSVINYFQDCSTFQSEDIGLGLEFLSEKKEVWILSSWNIIVNQYPDLGEEITVGTWAYGFDGFYGYRNFAMEDKNGNLLACADSLWVLMDLGRGRPKKVTNEIIERYKIGTKLKMDSAPRKIEIPSDGQEMKTFPVRKYHIDTNNHVNNGQYIQMAKEYIPEEYSIRQMRAEYKKAAVYGDNITPMVSETKDSYVVSLCEKSGKAYAVVEFSK